MEGKLNQTPAGSENRIATSTVQAQRDLMAAIEGSKDPAMTGILLDGAVRSSEAGINFGDVVNALIHILTG